ncbi:hypothetical protein IFT89_12625 [Plantibacter sp. CFBP 13570]|nr:hypothetical protein [Plantibacter sp. CFBP 13570]
MLELDLATESMTRSSFYLAGAHYPQVVLLFAKRTSWDNAAVCLLIYLASISRMLLLGEDRPGVFVPASISAVAAGVTLAKLVGARRFAHPIGFLVDTHCLYFSCNPCS